MISLKGNLGAGKTTLMRSILRSLGVTSSIKSPSYSIVEEYQLADFNLYHFDLYRFNDAEEWLTGGFDEYFNARSICCIEWSERAAIPSLDWQIELAIVTPISRQISITALSSKGRQCLKQLMHSDDA